MFRVEELCLLRVVSWKTGFVCCWNSVYIIYKFSIFSIVKMSCLDEMVSFLRCVMFRGMHWVLCWADICCSKDCLIMEVRNSLSCLYRSPSAFCLSNVRVSHGSDCVTMMVNNFQTLNVTSQTLGSMKSFDTDATWLMQIILMPECFVLCHTFDSNREWLSTF